MGFVTIIEKKDIYFPLLRHMLTDFRVAALQCLKNSDDYLRQKRKFHNFEFILHGLPDTVVPDRDPNFTRKYWELRTKYIQISTLRSIEIRNQLILISKST